MTQSAIDPYLPAPADTFLGTVDFRIDRPDGPVTEDTVFTGHLDVDERHHTPWGVVHGGVYATVVESITSVAASSAVLDRGQFAVGIDNVTDFIRPFVSGRLEVTCRAGQVGRSVQLWTAEITDERGKLIARGRVRLANQPLRG